MSVLRAIIAVLPFAVSAAQADIGARGLSVGRPITGLTMSMHLAAAKTVRQAGRAAVRKTGKTPSDFKPEFALRPGLLATLKRSRTMPLIQMVESRHKNLYLGISRDGTVGVHYRFRQKP